MSNQRIYFFVGFCIRKFSKGFFFGSFFLTRILSRKKNHVCFLGRRGPWKTAAGADVPFFLPAFSSKEKAEGDLKKLIQFIYV